MSHVPNELADLLPEYQEQIHELKVNDPHFSKLFDEYHTVNRAIHRAETNVEPTDDFHLEDMRKSRLLLLDELTAMLRHAVNPIEA